MVGSIFPGAGTVIGGVTGGLIGGAVGGLAGSDVGKWIGGGVASMEGDVAGNWNKDVDQPVTSFVHSVSSWFRPMATASKFIVGILFFGASSVWSYTSIGKPGLIGALLIDGHGRYRRGQGWFFLSVVPLIVAICLIGIPIITIAPTATGPLHAVRGVCDVLVIVPVVLMVVALFKNPLFPLPHWVVAQQQLVRQSTDDPASVQVGGDGSLEQRAFEFLRSQGTVTEREAADALSLSLPKTRRVLSKLVARSALGELPVGITITLRRGKGAPSAYVLTHQTKES